MNLLQVPQQGPYGERYPVIGHFYLSLNISLFIFPSESPVREPPPYSLTGSSWAAILCHQCQWSTFHSFIPVCLLETPKRSPPAYGEKHKVTVHGAPRRQKAYIQWGVAWFPKDHPDVTLITVSTEPSKLHEKMVVFIPFLLNIMYI